MIMVLTKSLFISNGNSTFCVNLFNKTLVHDNFFFLRVRKQKLAKNCLFSSQSTVVSKSILDEIAVNDITWRNVLVLEILDSSNNDALNGPVSII